MEGAWEVIEKANDPDATLILDAFHNWNSMSSPETLRQKPESKISHYHIDDACVNKESGTQTDPARVMPGDGQINLRAEIQILKEICKKREIIAKNENIPVKRLIKDQQIKFISNKAVQFQSGYIYDYAFVMLIGLSALITFLILN